MKYYKNTNNQVFAFEIDGSQDSYITDDLIAITDIEANDLIKKIRDELTGKEQKIVPQTLSRFQALTVLKLTKLEDGQTLYKATDDYINSLSDDSIENITAKTAWETAHEFRRDSALISLAEKMFNLSNKQVDEMFINGSKITA